VNRVLTRVGWRYLLRHPRQTLLMVLGIALGVAVVVAIDLANGAAGRAFALSTDAVAGRATHQIVGGPAGLDEALYARLRVDGGVQAIAPVIDDYVRSPQLGGSPLHLLGVDPFAEAPFRSYLVTASSRTSAAAPVAVDKLVAFLAQPGAVLISEDLAKLHGLAAGSKLTLSVAGRSFQGTIAGLVHSDDPLRRRALDGIVLADIATAQEITGRVGRLDYIDVILPESDGDLANRIARFLPVDARLVPASARSGAIAEMTAAFRTNLTALSLLALVVGMFLIYNTMTFSVIQRRPLFGTLRCLGVTREEIGRLVLAEAVIVGALGSVLGIGLGTLLGQGAVQLVSRTISDLYFVVTVRGVAISVGSLAKGAALGMLATVGSTILPAWEASSVPPRMALTRSSLEDTARRALPWTGLAAAAGLAVGGALLVIPTRNLVISFSGIFLVMIGFALIAPLVTLFLVRGAAPATGMVFGVLGRLASRNITATLSRTAVAIAALMVAVSVTIGVGLMVGSFRSTVVSWLDQTLWGDVYISAPSLTATRSSEPLAPQVLETVRGWPGVKRAEVLRSVDIAAPTGGIAVSAVSDEDFTVHRIFVSAEGGPSGAAQAVRNGSVLVSEPLANRLGLPAHGAHLSLYTDRGPHDFPVAGVYRDYASSQGIVMMRLDLYRSYWNDPQLTAIAISTQPGVDADQLARDLSGKLAGIQDLEIQPNRVLRSEVLGVFDQAFAITGALQLLAAVVAVIGVLSALLSIQLERGRELGTLRAVGLTVGQLRGLILLETGLMGAVAGLLAIPTGFALALILIYVINRRSFGWTLQLALDPAIFLQALALAVMAALLAGSYPAWRMSRMRAADALRGE